MKWFKTYTALKLFDPEQLLEAKIDLEIWFWDLIRVSMSPIVSNKYNNMIKSIWVPINIGSTSGSMWTKLVARRTPPPKQRRTEVIVLFQKFLPPSKSEVSIKDPSLRGRNPRMSEMPPSKDKAITLTVIKSILVHNVVWNRLKVKQIISIHIS